MVILKNDGEGINNVILERSDNCHKQGEIDKEKTDVVKQKRHLNRKLLSSLTAVVLCFFLLVGILPSLTSWACSNIPQLDKAISNDLISYSYSEASGSNNNSQNALNSITDSGYVFSVHRIVVTPTNITVFFSIDKPGHLLNETTIYPEVEAWFNNEKFYTSYEMNLDTTDGIITGYIDFNNGVNQTGDLRVAVKCTGDIDSLWDLTLPIDNIIPQEHTQIIPVNQETVFGDNTLEVESITFSPTQTVININYDGDKLRLFKAKLNSSAGPVLSQGMGSDYDKYELKFGPIAEIPSELVLTLDPYIYVKQETNIPLIAGESAKSANGLDVTVEEVSKESGQGYALISYPITDNIWSLDDDMWQVIDNTGRQYSAQNTSERNNVRMKEGKPQAMVPLLHWELPEDKTAVMLVNPGYWEKVQLPDLTITIPSHPAIPGQQSHQQAAPKVFLDGKEISFDVPPITDKDLIMVPIRPIFEAMGAAVDWNQETRTVRAAKEDITVLMPVGSRAPTINGQAIPIEAPIQIIENRTFAPVRFVSEAFGGTLLVDSPVQEIHISSAELIKLDETQKKITNQYAQDITGLNCIGWLDKIHIGQNLSETERSEYISVLIDVVDQYREIGSKMPVIYFDENYYKTIVLYQDDQGYAVKIVILSEDGPNGRKWAFDSIEKH